MTHSKILDAYALVDGHRLISAMDLTENRGGVIFVGICSPLYTFSNSDA